MEMEMCMYQHLVAAKEARWVESPRELLVMGPGKGWRPDPGDDSQSAQLWSLWRAGHRAG